MPGGVDIGWVLVVDDDELFRRHACRTLGRWVSCRPASSPSEALALADEHAGLVGALVDLVLGRVPDFLPEDIPNGVDDVAIPLRSMHPAIDIRILSGAVMDFRGALARASKAGLGFMTKCDVEDLDALGPFFRRAAEDDARRRADHVCMPCTTEDCSTSECRGPACEPVPDTICSAELPCIAGGCARFGRGVGLCVREGVVGADCTVPTNCDSNLCLVRVAPSVGDGYCSVRCTTDSECTVPGQVCSSDAVCEPRPGSASCTAGARRSSSATVLALGLCAALVALVRGRKR